MMDHIVPLESEIKKKIFLSSMSLLNFEVDVLFFDVTTLYFESFDPDKLRNFGFSKDCKFKETQIVLALITDKNGMPLTYEIFPGNQSEGKTLIDVVGKIKSLYSIKNIVIVADRAMFTKENLDFLESQNFKYIVAAKLRTLKQAVKNQFSQNDFCPLNGWVKDFSTDGRRLIVSYNVDRAKRDFKQRRRLIDRLHKKVKNGKIPVKDLINNNGTKKYIEVNGDSAGINFAKIEQDAQWEGLHGVITNFNSSEKSSAEVLERYKGLWKIEEVFRVNKNDLKMRPIYHWKPGRIRAHILICFMAYVLLNTTKNQLQKQSINISVPDLMDEVSSRQISIIRDRRSQRKFMVPSHLSEMQKDIYSALNLPIWSTARPL